MVVHFPGVLNINHNNIVPAGANQPVHWFLEGKELGIQQGRSESMGRFARMALALR